MTLDAKQHPKAIAYSLFFVISIIFFVFCVDMKREKIYNQHLKSPDKIKFIIYNQKVDLQYTNEQLSKINELLKYQYTPERIICCENRHKSRKKCTVRCEQQKFQAIKTNHNIIKKYENDKEYLQCKEILLKTFKKECSVKELYTYFQLNQITLSKAQEQILRKYFFKKLALLTSVYLIILGIIYKTLLDDKK